MLGRQLPFIAFQSPNQRPFRTPSPCHRPARKILRSTSHILPMFPRRHHSRPRAAHTHRRLKARHPQTDSRVGLSARRTAHNPQGTTLPRRHLSPTTDAQHRPIRNLLPVPHPPREMDTAVSHPPRPHLPRQRLHRHPAHDPAEVAQRTDTPTQPP